MPRSTFEIVARIKDQVSRPMRTIIDRFKSFGKTLLAFPLKALRAIFSPGGLLVGGIATLLSFRGFSNVVDGLDEIGKTAERVNATAESLSALKFAGELSAVSFQQLSTAFSQFSRNLENARRGAALQQGAFDLLGIQPTALDTGGRLDAVEILSQVADGLDRVGDASKRNDILLTLFGRSGANLGPLLAQGREGIRKLVEEAEALGVVFSREQLARAEQFNDAITRFQTTIRGFVSGVFIRLEPLLTGLVDLLQSFVSTLSAEDVKQAAFDFLLGIASIVDTLVNSFAKLVGLLNTLSGPLGSGGSLGDFARSTESLAAEFSSIFARAGGEGNALSEADQARVDSISRTLTGRSQLQGDVQPSNLYTELFEFLNRIKERPDPEIGPGNVFASDAEAATNAWSEFFQGFKDQAGVFAEDARNLAARGREAFTVVAQSLENGIANSLTLIGEAIAESRSFADVWKGIAAAFKDIGRAIVAELNRIIAKTITLKLLGGFATSAASGGGSSASGGGAGASNVGANPTFYGARAAAPASAAGAVGSGSSIVGDTFIVNLNLSAIDTRDGQQFLQENANTLGSIIVEQIGSNRNVRTAIRGSGGGV